MSMHIYISLSITIQRLQLLKPASLRRASLDPYIQPKRQHRGHESQQREAK